MSKCACGGQKATYRSQSNSALLPWQQPSLSVEPSHWPPKHLHWKDGNISCSGPSLDLRLRNLHTAVFLHEGSFQTSLRANAHVNVNGVINHDASVLPTPGLVWWYMPAITRNRQITQRDLTLPHGIVSYVFCFLPRDKERE